MSAAEQAEREILGQLILAPRLFESCDELQAGLFSTPDHRRVFAGLSAIWGELQPESIDPEILAAKAGLDLIFVAGLTPGNYRPDPVNFRWRVRALKRRRISERILKVSEDEGQSLVKTGEVDAARLEEVRGLFLELASLNELEEAAAGVEAATGAGLIGRFREFLQARRSSELWGWNLPSFPKLTAALMGLRELAVLAAKPKIGKSTLALQIAADVADQGAGVLYLDMENGAMNLLSRDVCRRANSTLRELYAAEGPAVPFIEGELLRLAERRNFAILQDRRVTVEKLRAAVKAMQRSSGQAGVLVVVDSLQKLPLDLKERRASVDAWLRGFEQLMAELPGLAVLMISELSRGAGQPKESGDIEYTGHFLLRLRAPKLEAAEVEALKGGSVPDRSDDGRRELWIETARDVPAPGVPIILQADFERWRLEEV